MYWWPGNEAHSVLILRLRFLRIVFRCRPGGRSLTQRVIQNITTWSPDGERRRLTSDTPRYLRRRLIAASTRTSRPDPLAFQQNSEAAKRRMQSCLCVRGLRLPLPRLPPTANKKYTTLTSVICSKCPICLAASQCERSGLKFVAAVLPPGVTLHLLHCLQMHSMHSSHELT